MLGLIFEEIENYIDLVLFAFSCEYLLDIGYRHMASKRRQYFAPWAGDAIICLGEYTTALPEKEEVPETVASAFMEAFNAEEGLVSPCFWAPPSFLETMNWFPCGSGLHRTLREWLDRRFVHNSLRWTLRNLSTRQYVRDNAIKFYVPEIDNCTGLGQALAFRCGWSQDSSTSTPAEGLNEGCWAGDKLDIVLHDKDAEWAKEWEDVSLQVEGDIRKGYIADGLLDEDGDKDGDKDEDKDEDEDEDEDSNENSKDLKEDLKENSNEDSNEDSD